MEDRLAVWDLVHTRLRSGWHIGPPSYDPARSTWEIVARSPKPPGRRSMPRYVVGEGVDEIAALRDLAAKLGR